ncbi:hypothetical protein PR202_gb28338 [Eleusine coracana subsp. coracana]|uniref:RRM domain-containing protein n=1 Tax=Eleusine coracana subsp. coracana TaxID=191504 RepID=A0AAV5FWT4_ELECO|nr:hypothetical protein QOZ80_6AG0549490 [Eleusine coracana subsp. coracana]GJN39233.1 hypothetical protein PR202_gb28338 [Eleusine coracana subsp. coracana]
MAAATCRCSSVVFVGNIPYHAGDEELRSACEEIGPVVSLRVAKDRDSGKRRGYAFCEYLDDETALSACRNLDGRPLRGRDLRVRLADRSSSSTSSLLGGGSIDDHNQPVGVAEATHAATLLVASSRPSAAVTAFLAGMSRRQMREMLDLVDAADATVVELARREYDGFATLIDQAKVLLDMVNKDDTRTGGAAARKRHHHGESPEPAAAGQEATKMRRLEDGKFVPGVACR